MDSKFANGTSFRDSKFNDISAKDSKFNDTSLNNSNSTSVVVQWIDDSNITRVDNINKAAIQNDVKSASSWSSGNPGVVTSFSPSLTYANSSAALAKFPHSISMAQVFAMYIILYV